MGERYKRKQEKRTMWIRCVVICTSFAIAMYAYLPETFDGIGFRELFDWVRNAVNLMLKDGPEEAEGFLEFAKVVCPITTGVFIISYFMSFLDQFWNWLRSLIPGSVAIYGTSDLTDMAAEGTRFIRTGNTFRHFARNHVILMDNDDESLRFYKEHELWLKMWRKKVCIGLQQMSSGLMAGTPEVSYFNIYEEVARNYWRKYSPREEVEKNPVYKIVILGYMRDNLGYQLLKYGIMNNIFRLDQKITYEVFCKPEEAERGFEYLNMMTKDTIVWNTMPWQKHLDVIGSADRILLCRSINPHILNQLLLICTTQQIDYYDPGESSYPEKYEYRHKDGEEKKIRAFGCTQDVLNKASILKNELYKDAMERHFHYIENNGTPDQKQRIAKAGKRKRLRIMKQYWDDLDGFLKNSNAATSDYYGICQVKKDACHHELLSMAKLEHIRWCRFHYLSGWKYGEPEKGSKDKILRIHKSLVPWEALSRDDRRKDLEQIQGELGYEIPIEEILDLEKAYV